MTQPLPARPLMRLIGLDGCRAGWVVAACDLDADGAEFPLAALTVWVAPSFAPLLEPAPDRAILVAVDMPIGLPTGHPRDDGRRQADEAARAFLGGRRGSSVFAAPCRPTLACTSYRAACASELATRGSQLSQQAFRIIPKVREVDAAVHPAHQRQPGHAGSVAVREAHPESVFAALLGGGARGYGLTQAKRTPEGEAERLALLQPFVGALDLGAIRSAAIARFRTEHGQTGGPVVGRDDIVDAAACLVAAYRVVTGQSLTFPAETAAYDERGLRMEIVA